MIREPWEAFPVYQSSFTVNINSTSNASATLFTLPPGRYLVLLTPGVIVSGAVTAQMSNIHWEAAAAQPFNLNGVDMCVQDQTAFVSGDNKASGSAACVYATSVAVAVTVKAVMVSYTSGTITAQGNIVAIRLDG